jgi:hypothetical protein
MRQRMRTLATTLMFAGGTAAAVLVVAWPRTTFAEEIPDSDRMGDYEEEGMKFGNIVVKGELVADGTPSGWSLVRTFENQSDAPEKCVIEERVLRTETMPGARVTPASVAVVQRNQTIALGPHEKRKIGVRLSESIGAEITAGLRKKAWIEQAQQRAIAAEHYDAPAMRATYMTFDVEYLSALPAGATAERHHDNGVLRPMGMPEMMPMPVRVAPSPPSSAMAAAAVVDPPL